MAMFVCNKLKKDRLLIQALNFDLDLGTNNYGLVLVGHSIAAGVAALLSLTLRSEFPDLHCYAYSPPSGIIRDAQVEETKSFVTSVVVGKDLIPRIGTAQTVSFRQQIFEALAACHHSKWRIIFGGMCCYCLDDPHVNPQDVGLAMQSSEGFLQRRTTFDSQPVMCIPGRVIHIIRSHPKSPYSVCSSEEPVYQAIWAEYFDFSEILISPTMLSDHSPYVVLDALQKVLTRISPTKPTRRPQKHRGSTMTPNTSSNLCDPSQSDFQLHPLDLDAELTAGKAVVTLNPNRHASWRKLVISSDTCEISSACSRERPRSFSLMPRQHLLELRRDDLSGSAAPLASPEVLSETSSLASFGSGGGSMRQAGYQRLMSGAGRMDPIKQSPLTHPIHARGYCLMLEPPSSGKEKQDVSCIILSPVNDAHGLLAKSSDGVRQNGDDAVEYEAEYDERGDEQSCLIPLSMETSPVASDNVMILKNHNHYSQVTEIEIHEQKESVLEDALELYTDPTEETSVRNVSFDETLDDVQVTALGNTEFDCRSFTFGIQTLNDSDRESVESGFGRQYLYDSFADHYSPAGRGYPHGFNFLPVECHAPATLHSTDGSSSYQSVSDFNDVAVPSGDESFGSCVVLESNENNDAMNSSRPNTVVLLAENLLKDERQIRASPAEIC